MKKNFRNRLLAVTAAASMSIMLLSGFDSSLTVEDVTRKTTEAMSAAGGLNCDVQGIADVSVDVSAGGETQSMAINGSLNYSVQFTVDPFVMAVSGEMTGEAAAMGVSEGMKIEVYLAAREDGSGVMYVRMPDEEESGWHAAAVTAEDMTMLRDSVKASLSGNPAEAADLLGMDLEGLKEQLSTNMTLAPEAVNVNGIDCYELTQSVDGTTLFNAVSTVMNAMPDAGIDQATLSAIQMLLGGIRMDVVSDCAVDTFEPVYASLDLGGSDFSMLGQMYGAMAVSSNDGSQGPEISVNVNALNLSMNYGEVPAAIEIPSEALEAEIETTVPLTGIPAETEVQE